MWEASPMPWAPELFSAPALEKLHEQLGHELDTVPFFEGLLAGEFEALAGSFAGAPELHHPVRGRVKGMRAFETYVNDTNAWLRERNASIENVSHVKLAERGFGEAVLHLDGENAARIELPIATVVDLRSDGRITELRMYYSTWPLYGRHRNRQPLLQPDPELRESGVVGEYQSALLAGDVDAVVAAFEPDGYAREPAGAGYVHRGTDALRAHYEHLFSNHGGIVLQHCAAADDQAACALEYNVVRWGQTELPPQAGVAVYVRGQSGKLAAARIYDDVDPPLGSGT
jgi:SnoaL-like domain